MLNGEGSSFDVIEATVTTLPFRPYFTYQASPARQNTVRRIAFNQTSGSFDIDDRDPSGYGNGELAIKAKRGKIVVASTLATATDVRIVSSAGAAVQTFTIQPGESIDTHINYTGIYIVTTSNGQTKKLRVETRYSEVVTDCNHWTTAHQTQALTWDT